jgi:hypothetical protein
MLRSDTIRAPSRASGEAEYCLGNLGLRHLENLVVRYIKRSGSPRWWRVFLAQLPVGVYIGFGWLFLRAKDSNRCLKVAVLDLGRYSGG